MRLHGRAGVDARRTASDRGGARPRHRARSVAHRGVPPPWRDRRPRVTPEPEKNSTLPARPGQRAGHRPRRRPVRVRPRRRPRRAPPRPAAPDRAPRPPSHAFRPTSNCGFTIGQIAVRARAGHQRRQDQAQRDERQVGDGEVDRAADRLRRQRTHVGAFQDGHPGITTQRPGQLPVPHVDRDHLGRASRNSTSVKPPVEAPASRQRRPATVSPCGRNAASAPASLCPPRETYSSPRRRRPARGRPGRPSPPASRPAPAHLDPTGRDQCDGLLPRPYEPAPDELRVEAAAGHQTLTVNARQRFLQHLQVLRGIAAAGFAERQQQLAFRAELEHLVSLGRGGIARGGVPGPRPPPAAPAPVRRRPEFRRRRLLPALRRTARAAPPAAAAPPPPPPPRAGVGALSWPSVTQTLPSRSM